MASTQVERTLAEIANKIKQTNKELCCINTTIIDSIQSQYIPAYEVAILAFPEFVTDGGSTTDRNITYNLTNSRQLVFGYNYGNTGTDLELCSAQTINDLVISFSYEDSAGRVINSTFSGTLFSIIVDNDHLSNATINFKIILKKESGFIIEYEDVYHTDSASNIIEGTFFNPKITTNTNKNYEYLNYNTDFSGKYYVVPMKTILEERKNEVFLRYVDSTDTTYVPSGCIFYEKPDSLQPYTPSKIDLQFNQTLHQSVFSNASYFPNTLHIFSVTAISGVVELAIGIAPGSVTVNTVTIPNGTSITLPATGLISNYIEVNVTGGSGSSAYVTLIKP